MAAKEDLQARAAECAGAADFAALAREALEQPADPEYAKHLLQQGEAQCQFPSDYIQIAEAAISVGDKDYAAELYAQAEEFCMEGKEFAQVANSIGAHTEDKEKARELLQQAVDKASQAEEFLTYSKYAAEGLGDASLAASLLDKVRDKINSLDDYKQLAAEIAKEQQDPDTARTLYQNAAGLADEPDQLVAYAEGMIGIFNDRDWAEQTLAASEGDCMFPGQFVALAEGYKRLLENTDKVAELLGQGKEFAMSGAENLDLANGYADLLGDMETATELYENALADFSTKDDLLRLAGDMAEKLKDKDLAAKAYAKAEEKITDANDLALLANAVKEKLGADKMAAEVFSRAAEKLDQPNDLVRLGGEIYKTLNDQDLATTAYRKALAAAGEFPALVKIMDALGAGFDNPVLARDVVTKTLETTEDSPKLVDTALRAHQLLHDSELTGRVLDAAEEAVTSLDEMKQLVGAVKKLAADDTDRSERVQGKLEKREASQASYIEFQDREKKLSRPSDYMQLAQAVVTELNDKFYAAKLLGVAEESLNAKPFEMEQYTRLLKAVDRLTDDQDWVKRLLDKSAENCSVFRNANTLGKTATRELKNKASGLKWAKDFYAKWEQRIAAQPDTSAFEFAKLAQSVKADLDDKDWAMRLLESAQQKSPDHLLLSHLGQVAKSWGEQELADSLFQQAAEKCASADQFLQMARRLQENNEPLETQRAIYALGDQALTDPRMRLRWAEGILELFGDKAWAEQAFDNLNDAFTDEAGKEIYRNSRRFRLEGKRV